MEIRTQHHKKLVPDEAARFIQHWYIHGYIIIPKHCRQVLQPHARRRYSERKGRSSSARAGRNARARWVNFLKSRPSPPVGQSLFDLLTLLMRFLLFTTNLQLMTSSDIMQAKLMEQQVTLWQIIVEHHTAHDTRYTSHITRHMSHVTRQTLHITRNTFHITCHASHIAQRTLHVTRQTSHLSHFTPHTSHLTPSHDTFHTCYYRSRPEKKWQQLCCLQCHRHNQQQQQRHQQQQHQRHQQQQQPGMVQRFEASEMTVITFKEL